MVLERFLKIFIVAGTFAVCLGFLTYFLKNFVVGTFARADEACVLVSPYSSSDYKVYGEVFDPVISMPVLTKNGYKKVEFLVDTGAVVSTIPKTIADEIFDGDYDDLERTVLKGFGGGASFGYVGEMNLKFGNEILEVPVVFSELDSTKAILGRKGFLDILTSKFDHVGEFLCIIN
jgi:hypothetical protein